LGEFSTVNADEKFMQRAIEVAQLGLGHVSPNPMVGCVIVHEGKIIGEGYHQRYGEAHAEVNAVNSVVNQELLKSATAYVTLEPCAHFGKTPPCADLLIAKGVKRVVIGTGDPFDQVDGKGIEKLKQAGMDVEVGVLERKCWWMNRRFFTFIEKKRPFVILKWAQTNDGFIARTNYDSKWISNQYSRQLVHKWRSEEDSILVGKNTAIHDDPALTVREWEGGNPIRVVIDNKLELPEELKLFDGSTKTFVMNEITDDVHKGLLKYDGSISHLLERLAGKGIQSIIIEGGAKTLNSFIEQELWDEARVFTSNVTFEEGIESPNIGGLLASDEEVHGDRLETYINVH
jgi:diaminohydroxyphosphoribosylaminopyrimidine deaminase/5-amino-6-(5-phosphoribosylamino)uracil reductase